MVDIGRPNAMCFCELYFFLLHSKLCFSKKNTFDLQLFTFSLMLHLSLLSYQHFGTASSNALYSHTLDNRIICLVCLWSIKH